jgi:hypothetical protein
MLAFVVWGRETIRQGKGTRCPQNPSRHFRSAQTSTGLWYGSVRETDSLDDSVELDLVHDSLQELALPYDIYLSTFIMNIDFSLDDDEIIPYS